MITAPNMRTGMRYAAGILLLGVPFIFTLSRASYLGALAVAPVLIYYSRRKLIAGFAIVTIFLIMVLMAPASVTERIRYTFGGQGVRSDQVAIGNIRLDTSTSARIMSYQQVLEDFPKNPVIGYGVTGYSFVDGQYVRVLIETGLVGLAAFLWLLVALVRQGLATIRSATNEWERGLAIGYLAGLAGLLLHAIGSNTFIIVRIMEPFWFFTGAVTLLHLYNTGEQAEELPATQPKEWTRFPGLLRPPS
jgi:O-antigen ligase